MRGPRPVLLRPPKTAAGIRTLALPPFIVEELEYHLAHYGRPARTALVFTNTYGGMMDRHNFRQRVWLPALEASGLENLRFHGLRHTGATLAAAGGAPLRAIMHRLGHASAATALRYQHRMAGQDEAIAEYLQEVGPTVSSREVR